MNPFSLSMAALLVVFAITISRYQRLGLEKDILVGTLRAVIQLLAVGYILHLVFDQKDWRFTTLMLLVMVLVAAQNAAAKGKKIPRVLSIAVLSISTGTGVTLAALLGVGVISYSPWEAIPISGMIVGNAMVACSLVFNNLNTTLKERKAEVETALALGATARQAVDGVLRGALKAGMIPTVDSLKTLGIVQLPGMMTGLILAGVSPMVAVRYQILVAFMLSSAVAIACVTAGLLTYRQFFNKNHQALF